MVMARRSLKKKIARAESKINANKVIARGQAREVTNKILSPQAIGAVAVGGFVIWLAPKTISKLRHKIFAKKVSNGVETVMEELPPTVTEKVSNSKKARNVFNYVMDGAAAISSLSSILSMLKQRKK